MRRKQVGLMLAVPVALIALSATLSADVTTQEKSLVKFGGALGKLVGMFGGKAAREGMVSTVALKGDRRARTTDRREEIVDLAEEKVYNVDLDDKSYTVTTFAELRKKMEEAQQRAKQQTERTEKKDEKAPEQPEKEYEVDFDIKETGQKKSISGYDTRQVIMTIAVREKGKTLEQAGGIALTADSWLGPEIPQMKEIAEFELRYAQKLYGGLLTQESMQTLAAALAAHPGLKDAMSRYQKEKVSLQGTPLATVVTFDAVKSNEQMAAEAKSGESSDEGSSASPGGLLGGFARRMAKKKAEEPKENSGGPANRATIMTMTNDVLKIEPSASAEAVAVPAGFKQKS